MICTVIYKGTKICLAPARFFLSKALRGAARSTGPNATASVAST